MADSVPRRWQLTCPRGHANWEAIDSSFWCRSCEEHDWPGDGRFSKVEDQRTGERLDREAVRELHLAAEGVG